jgi:hypothetical protein
MTALFMQLDEVTEEQDMRQRKTQEGLFKITR